MAQVQMVKRNGAPLDVALQPDLSLMEIIRDTGAEDEFALCGGALSCATCHVYMDPAIIDHLPAMTGDESDLLDGSAHRKPESRLSCQIPCIDVLANRRVEIAPVG